MFHTILNILMWFFIGLFALVVGFWIYGMITDKNFREANFEGWKASQYKNRKQKWRREDTEYYKRTGNVISCVVT